MKKIYISGIILLLIGTLLFLQNKFISDIKNSSNKIEFTETLENNKFYIIKTKKIINLICEKSYTFNIKLESINEVFQGCKNHYYNEDQRSFINSQIELISKTPQPEIEDLEKEAILLKEEINNTDKDNIQKLENLMGKLKTVESNKSKLQDFDFLMDNLNK